MCVTCCPFLRAGTLSWSLSCSATPPSTSPAFSGEYHMKLLWVVKEEGAETRGSFWVSSWATKRERAGRLESWMKAGFGGLPPQLRVLGLWGQHWVSHNQVMEALVVSSAFWRTVTPEGWTASLRLGPLLISAYFGRWPFYRQSLTCVTAPREPGLSYLCMCQTPAVWLGAEWFCLFAGKYVLPQGGKSKWHSRVEEASFCSMFGLNNSVCGGHGGCLLWPQGNT